MTYYNFRVQGRIKCISPDDGLDTLKAILSQSTPIDKLRIEVGDDQELVIE